MGNRRSKFSSVFILITILIGILIFGAIGGTISVVRYGDTFVLDVQHEKPAGPELVYDKPSAETIRNPYAILVLDVSGSLAMRQDLENIQARAVHAFFDTYSTLAQEILREGEAAKLSVVLFGTVAEIIDWSESSNSAEPFLEISYQENMQYITGKFRRAIDHFIGEERDKPLPPEKRREVDPRWGQDTNYDQALNAIELLLNKFENKRKQRNQAHSPPLVIFMTDGDFHPHQYFLVHEEYRASVPTEVKHYYFEKGKEYFRTDSLLYVKKPERIFDRNLGGEQGIIEPNNFFHQEKARQEAIKDLVKQQVEDLLDRRYLFKEKEVPLVWFPVLLNDYSATDWSSSEIARNQDVARESVESLLAYDSENINLSKETWGLSRRFIECQEAHTMIPSFISVLANWFRLTEVSLSEGQKKFQVPNETQAFAVQYELKSGFHEHSELPKIKDPSNNVHELKGAGESFGGVFAGEYLQGSWSLDNVMALNISGGTLYLRPRYDWALNAPNKVFLRQSDQQVEVALQLIDIRTGEVVKGSVYNNLPELLDGAISYDQEGEKEIINFYFEKVDQTKNPGPDIYLATPQISGEIHGEVFLSVSLLPLRDYQVPFQESRLEALVEVQHGLYIRITDERGRETGLRVTYPLAGWQVKAWFRRNGE